MIQKEERRIGECHNGFKVAVFKSINDYSQFMHSAVTFVQKELIKHALETNVDLFMSDAKKNAKCLSAFPNEHLKMAEIFTKNFLTSKLEEPIEIMPELTTASTSRSLVRLGNEKINNVKLFGYDLNESLAVVLLGCGLLIPAALLGMYMFFQYVARKLNKYSSVKLNNTNVANV